ncbi:MAG: Na(+)/H(+) antiporter subunit B [Fimbriimonadaceae bacterium]|nr:Na(+)/H(+) antiporter subunit B [Alphaproteobacteria bacterium]
MKFKLIARIGTKLILPFILAFALYVQFHGDYGPGGGFQAGVIAAAMIILYAVIFGLESAKKIVSPLLLEFLIPAGAMIYTGVGIVSMLKGGEFLNYSVLMHDTRHGQEWGIMLVEIGVLVTVFATMTAIFYIFAGRGR